MDEAAQQPSAEALQPRPPIPVVPVNGLAARPAPAPPTGTARVFANRMLTYARPNDVTALLPILDHHTGGLVIAGNARDVRRCINRLRTSGYAGPIAVDPAAYEKHTATEDNPFHLVDDQITEGALDFDPDAKPMTLDDVLDRQIAMGMKAALTPTGYIAAGDTDVLREAAAQAAQLGRNDVVFVAPLDIALLDRAYFPQTKAILANTGLPVALVLGRQFDPLAQSDRIIPNLRELAAAVPLMAMRTDFNAFDLTAHGAFAGAIGTSSTTRHVTDPAEKPKVFNSADQSPAVLVPELVTFWKGSKLAELYGARPSIAPWCDCVGCGGRRLSQYTGKAGTGDRTKAMVHAVLAWSQWAVLMLGAPSMLQRAEFWRNLCAGAVDTHEVFSVQLQRAERLEPQKPLRQWASLPPWPLTATPST